MLAYDHFSIVPQPPRNFEGLRECAALLHCPSKCAPTVASPRTSRYARLTNLTGAYGLPCKDRCMHDTDQQIRNAILHLLGQRAPDLAG